MSPLRIGTGQANGKVKAVNWAPTMQITYTQLTATRMAERGIRLAEVEATLMQPLRQIPASNRRTESHHEN